MSSWARLLVGVAFFAGWVGGWEAWTPHPVPLVLAALAATLAAALVESLPLPVDDNWTVPAVATAVLMLQDDGKLNVHDPVAKYLPEFANLKTPAPS